MKSGIGPRAALITVSVGLFLGTCSPATLGQQASPSHASASQSRKIIVTVTDSSQKAVADLKAENFKIYVDGQPQQIASVTTSDTSTCLGLVVDTSGSMRGKQGNVTKALLNLVSAANPQGQTFVVNFNDNGYLDQDFTAEAECGGVRHGKTDHGFQRNVAQRRHSCFQYHNASRPGVLYSSAAACRVDPPGAGSRI